MTSAGLLARDARRHAPRPVYSQSRRLRRTAYLFLTPAVLFFGGLYFYPLGSELVTSLYTGPRADRPVGAGNYTRAFADPAVRHSFLVTLGYAAGVLAVSIGLGLLLALVLNERWRGRTTFRGVLLVPYLTSVVIVGLMWRNILDPQVGILNRLLTALGLPTQSWLTSDPLAVLVGIGIWQHLGYVALLFLAGLQGIPETYYEAAHVDGAGPWHRFRHVTLPLLAPTTLFVGVIGVITSLQQFALPYIVTRGGPGDATDLYILHVFRTAFTSRDFGYASALSSLLLVVLMVLTVLQLRGRRPGTG